MKTMLLVISLAAGLAAQSGAGETLRLRLEPDHEYLLAGSPQEVVVKIDLSALEHRTRSRHTQLNLAVVLDRSGSMTGAKIEKARQAATQVVDRLAPEDIFSFVVYSDRAQVVFPAQPVEDKEALKARIERVQPGGSTALYAGVELGAEQVQKHYSARRINRVLLLSDGLANVGPSSPRELRRLGGSLSERGLSVTTIGVGDDYNEDLMAGLAEASDANYYYVKDTEKLPEIFAKELGELLTVAARDIRIEIICPDGVRPIGFLGRPEKFAGQMCAVRLNQLAVAQSRYLLLDCLVEDRMSEIARVNVSYIDELNGGAEQTSSAVATVRFTEDRKLALNSLRADVTAQKELFLAAVAKDQALADADAGHYQQAAERLDRQAHALDYQYQNAPVDLKPQLRQEIDNLKLRSNQLQQNQYDAGTRKSLQSESWTVRNSK